MKLRKILAQSHTLAGLVYDTGSLKRRLARVTGFGRQQRLILAYFGAHEIRKLQLGTGHNLLKGWLCTDINMQSDEIIYLDATMPFPFPDNAFDYIFCEHMIEHISWQQGQLMLAECRRVLKTDGAIRVATPDLAVLLGLYGHEQEPAKQAYIDWISDWFLSDMPARRAAFVINNAFRNWGHQFLYDHDLLEIAFRNAGFLSVSRFTPRTSEDENLRGLESHGHFVGNTEINDFETLVMEARGIVR